MAKQRSNSGFTAIEMMFTLAIVSTILTVTVIHLPKYDEINPEKEVKDISYLFQSVQLNAIQKQSPNIVEIDYINHQINVKDNTGKRFNHYKLNHCKFKKGGIERFIYQKNGDTSAFGTIKMICAGAPSSIIFQIQKGRHRIE